MRAWTPRRYYLGSHEPAPLQRPDLECLVSPRNTALEPGDSSGDPGRRRSVGCELAYRPDRPRPAPRGTGATTYLGLSDGADSTGTVRDVSKISHRADD